MKDQIDRDEPPVNVRQLSSICRHHFKPRIMGYEYCEKCGSVKDPNGVIHSPSEVLPSCRVGRHALVETCRQEIPGTSDKVFSRCSCGVSQMTYVLKGQFMGCYPVEIPQILQGKKIAMGGV